MRRWLPALGLCCACAHAATECPQPARVQLRQPVVVTAQEQAALQQLPQPLRVVAVGTPPLALYDQAHDRYSGLGIDALCFISAQLGLRFHIESAQHLKVLEKIALVQNGQADIFLPLSPTPERSQRGHFTAPLYQSHYVAIARKGQMQEVASTADLARYRVGVVAGVALEPILQQSIPQLLRFRESFSAGGLFDALRDGQIDIAVFSRDFYQEQRYHYELFDLEIIHALKEYPRSYGFYLGQSDAHRTLAQVMGRYVQALDTSASLQAHAQGEHQLIERYLAQRQQRSAWQAASIGAALLAIVALLALRYYSRLTRQLARSNQQIRTQQHALQAANAQLERVSQTDALTHLANRRRYDQVLAQEYARCQRSGSPLSLLMLDLDFFKAVNDHYGHATGDDYLRAVAQVLQQHAARASDLAARYGGEEFVCLLPDTPLAQAVQIAEAIRAAVAALGLAHAQSPYGHLTASIGVATLGPQTSNAQALQAQADAQLYLAKTRGRNQVAYEQ